MIRVAIYLRVSTSEQTTDNQLYALKERIEAREDWTLVNVYKDHGISGAKGRDKRPGLDRMMKDACRGQFDLMAAWSIDRLGRSLQDLVSVLAELQTLGIGLYLHQQAIDTTTPAGRAMYGMVGVFAEYERGMIQERVKAGLSRAKANGVQLGRPPELTVDDRLDICQRRHVEGTGVAELADEYGVTRQTIYRVLKEAEAA